MGLELVVYDDDRLAEERAAFRAAAVEHVGEPGDVLEGNVAADRLEPVGQARAVDEQVERELVAHRADGGELGERVDGTCLRRHGKIDHLGLRDMFGNDASRPVGGDGTHLIGADFAIVSRCGFALVARVLDRAGLVHVDVPRVGADDALPWAQGGLDDDEVRLRAANEEVHIGRGRTCTLANQASRALAHLVAAIAAKRLVVNSLECLENLGEGAFAVIAVEPNHKILTFVNIGRHFPKTIAHQAGASPRGKHHERRFRLKRTTTAAIATATSARRARKSRPPPPHAACSRCVRKAACTPTVHRKSRPRGNSEAGSREGDVIRLLARLRGATRFAQPPGSLDGTPTRSRYRLAIAFVICVSSFSSAVHSPPDSVKWSVIGCVVAVGVDFRVSIIFVPSSW